MQVTDKVYQEHHVFIELQIYIQLYKKLAMSVFQFATMGTKAICNIDTYVYSSIQGTVDSMSTLLLLGRINDAYALLRKYNDSAIINIYSNLYLHENFNIQNLIVEKINNWVQRKEKIPEYRKMSQYIRESATLKVITDALYKDNRYSMLRDRCNDHTHYNFYHHAMLNDNEIYIKDRGWWLNQFSEDSKDIFILHLGYIFFLNNHYMMSSDHLDALESGLQPEKDSQYWVAPFIQDAFDEIITPRRPDITSLIKTNSNMQLS